MMIELNKIQELLEWLKIKIFLNTKVEQANKRYVKRGQVYYCYCGIGVGNEIQKLRPCVIMQNNIGNAKSGNVIIAPITHTYKELPGIVKIDTKRNNDGTILLDGYVNTTNVLCVSKARLDQYVTVLSKEEMKKIDLSIAISLDLMHYYAKIKKSLDDKINYIQRIKEERNKAEDTIQIIKNLIYKNNVEDIRKLLKNIDI